jgi:hypothetical protein
MSQHGESPSARSARAARSDQVLTAVRPDDGTLARGGTWLRDGTLICMPRRTRLALVRPQMLKARADRPAGS